MASAATAPSAVNPVNAPHTFTVTVTQDDGLAAGAPGGDAVSGVGPAANAAVSLTLTGTNGAIPDVNGSATPPPAANPSLVTGATNASGIFTVTFSSASAGLVTGHASADVSFARLASEQPPATTLVVTRATSDGISGDGADAIKRFVDARITIAPSAVNPVNAPHTFTVTVLQDDGLAAGAPGGDAVSGFGPAANAAVGRPLSGPNGAIPDVNGSATPPPAADPSLVTGTTNASGIFTVTFSSASAGLVTGHASADVSFARLASEQPPATPLVVTRATSDGISGDGADAIKRFVDARITIAPSAVNPVNAPHTFTVTVLQDDGLAAGAPGGDAVSGFGPAANAAVSLTLTGTNGAIPDVNGSATPPPAANPSLVTGATNASGIFTVTFSSASAGLVTGHASADVSFARLASEQPPATPLVVTRATSDGISGDGADAIKRFVDARITIAPSAVNPVNAPHTFTVTVLQDDGLAAGAPGGDAVSGFGPAANAAVSLTLTGTNGAIPDVNGSATPPPAANPSLVTGATNASGIFTVTFSSASAGLVTGHATGGRAGE